MQRSTSFDRNMTIYFFLLYFILYNLLNSILPIQGIMLLHLLLFFGSVIWLAGHCVQPHEQLHFPLKRDTGTASVPRSVKIE